MTDREKLLIALLSDAEERDDEAVSLVQVAAMLYEIGDEYRHRPRPLLMLVPA